MIIYDDEQFDNHEEDATTWIALADMMTGLMAIFLALSIAILVMQKNDQIVIIKGVTEALQNKNIDIRFNAKTGDITLAENVAFGFGQATLTPEGKALLDRFIPVYAEAIFHDLTPEQQDRINRLIVEGHTDSVGSYAQNMDLSTRRANAILLYVDSMPEFAHKQQLLQKMTAVGRGKNDANDNPSDEDRKVLFRFDFKNTFSVSNDDPVKYVKNKSNQSMTNGL
ncbi:OmpA family protein [Moraxella bovis]|uniref:OmpA/MotB family protein n=1 Tax=Moraxella bovis TaxID=476 RepID=UPI002227DBF2|nr:OmpA family protein [Moraxella bovis]UYZ67715.1 OmpA family protein [Moraxella bovis]UYZ70088.1 OmpA family protein [Moraxella bovis]UYZ74000.1 OmpA family protein [Moraxella bovis]UZA13379.1 OmpA family protein [Moraxella bovis]UZA28267.1 OmpA family protein [Moraxella bovis]